MGAELGFGKWGRSDARNSLRIRATSSVPVRPLSGCERGVLREVPGDSESDARVFPLQCASATWARHL